MIRVLLIDEQAVVRHGLRMRLALEPDLRVVGAAKSPEEALRLAPATAPDVVVIDTEMPGIDGTEAIRQMRDLMPNCAVLVLTMHGSTLARARAMGAGAQAFVEKQVGPEPLLQEIRRLAGHVGSS